MPRRPTGHYIHKLRDYYLPQALEQKQYWIQQYSSTLHEPPIHDQNICLEYLILCEKKIIQADIHIHSIKKYISYLSSA